MIKIRIKQNMFIYCRLRILHTNCGGTDPSKGCFPWIAGESTAGAQSTLGGRRLCSSCYLQSQLGWPLEPFNIACFANIIALSSLIALC